MSDDTRKATRSVVVAGALDTKAEEFQFVKEQLVRLGVTPIVVDFGVLADPPYPVDIGSQDVAQRGGATLSDLRRTKDKAEAMRVMSLGLSAVVAELHSAGRLDGILAMGGTGGTSIATAAMRRLPIGVPKLMVSTVAGGDVSAYSGERDVTMMPSVVDIAGVNRISRNIFLNAAAAMAGMVGVDRDRSQHDKPLIAASMFGNTTPCIDRARSILTSHGYEVLVFHATGSGGKTMRNLADDGLLSGMLDLTTTELADEVCGGVFTAGIERVRIAAGAKIPVVLAPGCVDMCNFGPRATVPEKYRTRLLYEWNPSVTLLRTDVDENRRIGEMLARTANACSGPTVVLLPLRGVSMLDKPGEPFWDPDADRACFDELRHQLRKRVQVIEVDANINDPEFAEAAAGALADMMAATGGESRDGIHA
jgi:uncharacterized protein (UPF0261 family)